MADNNINPETGRSYLTIEVTASSEEPWVGGIPDRYFDQIVGTPLGSEAVSANFSAAIPTNDVVYDRWSLGSDVPPFLAGREYFTNSYPELGQGGYRQFMGTTKSFSDSWIVPGWGN